MDAVVGVQMLALVLVVVLLKMVDAASGRERPNQTTKGGAVKASDSVYIQYLLVAAVQTLAAKIPSRGNFPASLPNQNVS